MVLEEASSHFKTSARAISTSMPTKLQAIPPRGIALADASLSVTVFPNPFSSATTIRLPKGVKQVRVFDAVGRQVHQASNISGTSYTLNRANLASGTYVLSVQVSNAQYSTLLIIE
jgi:hypothetical protein